jgi:hypothetical protein
MGKMRNAYKILFYDLNVISGLSCIKSVMVFLGRGGGIEYKNVY